MLLEIDALCSGYGRTQVLRDVSLTVGQGEIVALIGANGAGKSTLLNTIMGLVSRTSGDIRFDGSSIARLPTPSIVRAGLAEVPERRQLFGTMTVEENLRMGAYVAGNRHTIPALLQQQFARFPILLERRRQAAQTLSGGQQQMLAIARAMMSHPRLLLLDEPSLGLAPIVAGQIIEGIVQLRAAGGTVLIVEQNAHAALAVADRGYVLENGRVTLGSSAAALMDSTDVQDAYLGGRDGQFAIEGRIRARKRAILGR
jgi:branched-chain amino acid transport system ATP-binding protein